jgi:DNA-binding transcriptional ArsR family regulator
MPNPNYGRSDASIVIEMSNMKAKQVVAALGALAQDTRLSIYRLLVQKGPTGMPAGAVASKLGVPPSSLSFHLRLLMHAGLVEQERQGRQLIYAGNFEAMNDLIAYLTENCCGRGAAACEPACIPATKPNLFRANRPASSRG